MLLHMPQNSGYYVYLTNTSPILSLTNWCPYHPFVLLFFLLSFLSNSPVSLGSPLCPAVSDGRPCAVPWWCESRTLLHAYSTRTWRVSVLVLGLTLRTLLCASLAEVRVLFRTLMTACVRMLLCIPTQFSLSSRNSLHPRSCLILLRIYCMPTEFGLLFPSTLSFMCLLRSLVLLLTLVGSHPLSSSNAAPHSRNCLLILRMLLRLPTEFGLLFPGTLF